MTLLAPTVYDLFNRAGSGGWGTSLSGHSWTATVGADSSTTAATSNTPGFGLHTMSTSGVRICTVGPNVTDSDVRFQVVVNVLAAGAALYAGTTARYTDASNHYYFRVNFNTNQTVGWNVFKRVAAVDTSLGSGTVSGLTHRTNGRYWVRAKVTGTTLQLKVWTDAKGEPLTWTATITDSAISAAGQVGPRSEKPAGNTSVSPVASYSYFTCGPYADASGKALAYDLEVAWGADLTADASTWLWTPITSDIYLPDANSPAISTTFGRSDWAGQAEPANLTAPLNGIGGKYAAYNPASSNYPNVVRGTPVRERFCYSIVRFFGFANGWPPTWDLVTNQPTVALSASGVLRRLAQGSAKLHSALYRAVTTASILPSAYWPCEDGADGLALSSAVSPIAGVSPMRAVGASNFASTDGAPGSGAQPSFDAGGSLVGAVPGTGAVTSWRIQCLARANTITSPNFAVPISWDTADGNGWELDLNALSAGGLIYSDTLLHTFTSNTKVDDGQWHELRTTATQSGGNIIINVLVDGVTVINQTFAGTVSPIVAVFANTDASTSNIISGVGHYVVWNNAISISGLDTVDSMRGHAGETATDRITRLCAEEGIPLALVGGPSATTMGPQTVQSILDLLRECEAADLGALYDGQGAGVGYIGRAARYGLQASLVVDASLEQLSAPFQPQDDDQQIRNRWTVSRTNGSFAVVSDDDATDPMSTKRAGVYQDQTTVNVADDRQLVNQASWRVHVGTSQGFRYPTLPLDLFRNPEIGGAWLDVDLLGRVDVTNLPTPHPLGTVSLVVNGYTEAVGDFAWDVVANCSPYRPWEVFTIQDARLGRIETDGSTLHQNYSAGAVSLLVDSSGGLWTTGAVSFDVEIRGWQIHVTNISGSSSPQTFTVTAIPGDLGGGNSVKLWKPGVLAL